MDPAASLTYEPFYGLREKAFSLSADPRFLFRSPAHSTAFDELHTGIRRREGLIVLTGEIGTGKTTLCRAVLQHLDRSTFSSFVADPFISREDLLKNLLVDFGVISRRDLVDGRFRGASRSDLSYPLYEFLDSLVPLQGFAVAVIDEAQNLSLSLLEEIRVLSELEMRDKLLQVVLVGQPELRAKLKLSAMRQVDQRVSVRCELTSLDAAAVAGYVRHRLAVAGRGESRATFTPAALDAIHVASSGVPRVINRVCDRCLQRAFQARSTQIDAECVWSVVGDRAPGSTAPAPGSDSKREIPVHAPTPNSPTSENSLSPELAQFKAEVDAMARPAPSRHRSRTSRWWIAAPVATAAGAAALIVALSIGAPTKPVTVPGAVGQQLSTIELPTPPPPPLPPPLPRPLSLPSVPESSPSVLPRPAGSFSLPSAPESTTPASSIDSGQPRPAAQRATVGYAILVASFQQRGSADQLVEELVSAGFGAHAVERTGGPTGRVVQVQISGYTSAIEVQRDLQRIRERPGRFADARIVEQD